MMDYNAEQEFYATQVSAQRAYEKMRLGEKAGGSIGAAANQAIRPAKAFIDLRTGIERTHENALEARKVVEGLHDRLGIRQESILGNVKGFAEDAIPADHGEIDSTMTALRSLEATVNVLRSLVVDLERRL